MQLHLKNNQPSMSVVWHPCKARHPPPPPSPAACPHACPQFKDHLKKAEAISEFAKSKSIAEQRRFLPVYTVREEVLQVGSSPIL